MVKMVETTPGTENRPGAIAPSDVPKDYSKIPLEPATAPSNDTAATDLTELGEAVLNLSQGVLKVAEPSYKVIRDCRICADRWALENPELDSIDPGLREMEYATYLIVASTTSWAEKGRPPQADINRAQIENFSARDFKSAAKIMRVYAGNDD